MKYILTPEEQDFLIEVLESEGWRALLKVIDQLVTDQEQDVLKRNVSDGVDQLVHAKLRAEGAAKLRAEIERIKQVHQKSKRATT